MTTDHAPPATDPPDTELAARSRIGDRDAFAQIVARYQSLVCALAYSALGNFAQSEDVAQETFVTAWQKLSGLDDPAKLRGWLCGIARNLIQNRRRRQGREPTHAAELLETADNLAAPEPSPSTVAIQRDEETILWREIEKIPELYREPLILFYRQNQSIEDVAAALDLSEDVVKQRLSRGRKLLQEQMLVFVEDTLARTKPDESFTSNVMTALPVAGASLGKAASVAAAAAKGAVATTLKGLLGALLGPVLGGGFAWLAATDSMKNLQNQSKKELTIPPSLREKKGVAVWLAMRAAMFGLWMGTLALLKNYGENQPWLESAAYIVLALAWLDFDRVHRDFREFWALSVRAQAERSKFQRIVWVAPVFLAVLAFLFVTELYGGTHPIVTTVLILSWGVVGVGLGMIYKRQVTRNNSSADQTATGADEVSSGPVEFDANAKARFRWDLPLLVSSKNAAEFYEYRSRQTFLGWPLLHVNTGRTPDGQRRVARGWIAVGSKAVGIIAIGGAAIGLVSFGEASVGLIAFGGLSLGVVLAGGGLAVGGYAAGGTALGYDAIGGLAMAWHAAYGGLAVAYGIAAGGITFAFQPGDPTAQKGDTEDFFSTMISVLHTIWEMFLVWLLYMWAMGAVKKGAGIRRQPETEAELAIAEKAEAKRQEREARRQEREEKRQPARDKRRLRWQQWDNHIKARWQSHRKLMLACRAGQLGAAIIICAYLEAPTFAFTAPAILIGVGLACGLGKIAIGKK